MRVLPLALSLTALTLAGCFGGSSESTTTTGPTGTSATTTMDHSEKTYNVGISGNAFSNATLKIHTGDTVVWTHNDGPTTAHTVTSDSGDVFDSHPNCAAGVPVSEVCMTQGDTYPHKFESEGTFTIYCKIHSSMTMSVTVVAHNMTMSGSPA